MAISFDFLTAKEDLTLDESSGNTDDDIALGSLNANFATLLFTTLSAYSGGSSFAADGRIAQANDLISVTSGGTLNSVSLTGWDATLNGGAGGTVALHNYNGSNDGLLTDLTTTSGEQIWIYSDVNGAVAGGEFDGNVIFGIDASGDMAFAILMEETVVNSGETDLSFSMVTLQPIQDDLASTDDPDNRINLDDFIAVQANDTTGFDFTGAPANKVMFLLAPPAGGGSGGLLVTPTSAIVELNTSKTDPSAFALFNQNLNPGETLAFTFIDSGNDPSLTIPDLDHGEAILESNIKFTALSTETRAEFKIAQRVGNDLISVQVTALHTNGEDGDPSDGVGFFAGFADDTSSNITSITVAKFDGGEATFTEASGGSDSRISVDFAPVGDTNTVIISGLDEGDIVHYTAPDGHERSLVKMLSGVGDIGNFSTVQEGGDAMALDIFNIDDAGPTLSLSDNGSSLTGLELDETIAADLPGVDEDTLDRYADSTEALTGDDNAGADELVALPAGAIGQVTSNETVDSLFTTSSTFDTDGDGAPTNPGGLSASDTVSLVLVDGSGDSTVTSLATDLAVSDAGGNFATDDITLILWTDGKVYGMVDGETDPTTAAGIAATAFVVELTSTDPSTAHVKVTEYLPILHSGTTSTHDENLVLSITETDAYLGVQRDKTIVDGDDDSDSKTAIANITGDISFDDDGPDQHVAASSSVGVDALGVNLDETIGADRYNPLAPLGSADDPANQDNNGAADDVVTVFNSLTPIGELDTSVSGGIGTLFSLSGSDGSDGSGGALGYLFEFDFTDTGDTGIATNLTTTINGAPIVLFLESGDIIGRETDSSGDIALRISINDPTDPTSQIKVQQFLAYDHGGTEDPSVYDEQTTLMTALGTEQIDLKLTVTRTDFEGDTDSDSHSLPLITSTDSPFDFDDDGPLVDVTAVADDSPELADIALNLDESTNTDGNNTRDGSDLYNPDAPLGSADDPANQDDNGDLDDVINSGVTNETAAAPSETPAAIDAIGVLSTPIGEIADLFSVDDSDFGTDEEGGTNPGDERSDAISLVLSTDPVETNLVVTELAGTSLEGLSATQRTIWLVADATNPDTLIHGVIEGTTAGLGNDDNEFVAFDIELQNSTDLEIAQLVTTHWLPIDHGGSEDPSVFDEQITMILDDGETLSLKLETTVIDGDGDVAVDSDSVVIGDDASSFLSFDDDGVVAAIRETGTVVVHDETAGVQNDGDPPADDQDNSNLPAAFAALVAGVTGTVLQGWAQSSGAVVEVDNLLTGQGDPPDPDDDVNDFGTDGPALTDATVFSLAIPADGTDSGLDAFVDDTSGTTGSVLLYAENWGGEDMIVGRIEISGDADTSDNLVALAIMIDPDTGVLSVMQTRPMFNPVVSGVNVDVSIDETALQAVLTTTDGDGDFATDSVDIGNSVIIRDDGLSANGAVDRAVEEDDLDNTQSVGLTEDGSSNAYEDFQFNLAPLIDDGYDDPFTFSLKNTDATEKAATEAALAAANPGLTSLGETVKFDVTGNTVTLYVDVTGGAIDQFDSLTDRVVGTWTVDVDGLATYTAMDQLDHGSAVERIEASEDAVTPGLYNDNDQEETLTINFTDALRVLDADGTEVDFSAEPNFIQYDVQDDMPDIGDFGNNVSDGSEDLIPNKVIDFAAGSGDGELTSLQAQIGTDEGGADVTIESFQSSIVYGDPSDPTLVLTGERSADKKVVSYFDDTSGDGHLDPGEDEYFRLTIHDNAADSTTWTYEWEAFQDPPPVEEPVDFNAIKSGGPEEILSPPVGGGGLVVDFDGLLFDGTQFDAFTDNDWSPDPSLLDPTLDQSHDGIDDRPGSANPLDADDGNPDAEGFGIKDGQASQFNHDEGFYAVLRDTKGTASTADDDYVKMASLTFAVEGIGKGGLTYHIDWQIIDEGAVVDSDTATRQTLSGNAEETFDLIRLDDGSAFDAVYVRVWLDEGAANKGIRLLDFSIGVPQPTEDQALEWGVKIADFEGDYDTASFATGIDGTLENDDNLVAGVINGAEGFAV